MTSTNLRKGSAGALAASITFGIVALLATPAAARDLTVVAPIHNEALSHMVSTADLDLAEQRDVRRLDARVRAASRDVCAPLSTGRVMGLELQCQTFARKGAAPQVARLVDRAERLAAAGQTSRIAATIAVSASAR